MFKKLMSFFKNLIESLYFYSLLISFSLSLTHISRSQSYLPPLTRTRDAVPRHMKRK